MSAQRASTKKAAARSAPKAQPLRAQPLALVPPTPAPTAPLINERAPVTMTTCVETITPQQAHELLAKNVSNRAVRRSWVKTLTNVILRGEWLVTHQGIAITRENQLVDGQHRLMALVAAGRSVEMNVSYDVDPRAYGVIDGGVKRTTSDQLRESPTVVAVARMVWKLPGPVEKTVPSSGQIAQILDWARGPIERVVDLSPGRSARTSAGAMLPIAVYDMAGKGSAVLPVYAAFTRLEYDDMPPSVRALLSQITDRKPSASNGRAFEMAARTWRAFDPGNWEVKRIVLKAGTSHIIAEMNRIAEAYRKKHQPPA